MLFSLSSPWPTPPSFFSPATSTTVSYRWNHLQIPLSPITFLLVSPVSLSIDASPHLCYCTKSVAYPTYSESKSDYQVQTNAAEPVAIPSVIEQQQSREFEGINNRFWVRRLIERIKEAPGPEKYDLVEQIQLDDNRLIKTIDDFNDLLIALLVAAEPDLALRLFDKMPVGSLSPDCWTYSIKLRCHCKKDETFMAKQLLDDMIENGLRPNVITLTILINSFCKRGMMRMAFEVFEQMVGLGCCPNVQTYNCLLKGLCFVGRVEDAVDLLMKVKQKGQENVDIYSYTAVIDGLCKVGRSDEAMELLHEAIQSGLTPTVVTYNTFFNGYCKEGKPRKGFEVLKLMKEQGCIPDHICYSTLMYGLLKWGKTTPAFWVYKEMVEAGFKEDERIMNLLLREICRKSWNEEMKLSDVYEVFEKMKSWNYDIYPSTHCLMIHTFCVGNDMDQALINLHEMARHGQFPRMVTINRIIRGLCQEGRLGDALSVLVLAGEMERIPSKITYNLLIDELSIQGDVLAACNIYGAALKVGVIPHRKPTILSRS